MKLCFLLNYWCKVYYGLTSYYLSPGGKWEKHESNRQVKCKEKWRILKNNKMTLTNLLAWSVLRTSNKEMINNREITFLCFRISRNSLTFLSIKTVEFNFMELIWCAVYTIKEKLFVLRTYQLELMFFSSIGMSPLDRWNRVFLSQIILSMRVNALQFFFVICP